jgi:hypothetical protein
MFVAERFQPFPHGLVYAGIAVLVCWLALMASLAIRTVWRARAAHRRDANPALVEASRVAEAE